MFKTISDRSGRTIAAFSPSPRPSPTPSASQRSVSIKAPPEKIFAYIDDFHRWSAWSPYEKKDPAMKRTLERRGQRQGRRLRVGRRQQRRQGTHGDHGHRLPPLKDTIKLDFVKPFEGHNIAEFTLEPKGDVTNVTWAMYGPAPFITKIMQVFFNMDNMIGKDFEAGLANLKALAEK